MDKQYDAVADTKAEWNELGFYYDYNNEAKEWRIEGSREGLLELVKILRNYASKERNSQLSEHDHLGPYMYLKIVTSELPQFNDDGIYGTLPDLQRLSKLIEESIGKSEPGDTLVIDKEYSNSNETVLSLIVRDDGFDPSEPDDFAWAKK